tara:strand:+ start:344 stop:526 length:183 start_codon:yes stop_codon:yes gene_type:complete
LREALGIKGNPVGKIVHHDLSKNGKITYYNIQINEEVYTHIPARMVEATLAKEHKHEAKE